jgi:hydroxymethylglutaryl-CoA reductase
MILIAITKGILIASTSYRYKAIHFSRGIVTVLTADGMTYSLYITFKILKQSDTTKLWLDSDKS